MPLSSKEAFVKMIQAIVRPEKANDVVLSLEKTGILALTRMDVMGHGRQRGIHVGTIHYAEIAKVFFMIVVENHDMDRAVNAIRIAACTGNPGDGKIFVSSLLESRTIRESGKSVASQKITDHESTPLSGKGV
jgi:nitrogen regulatory protein PII 1